jgi:hypothetical protein
LSAVDERNKSLEEALKSADKAKVEAEMIFCLKCGDHFEKAEDLYLHVEGNLNCETKENLQFLSKQGQNQKGEEEATEENSGTNLLIKEKVIENDHNLVDTGQPLKNKRGKYKKNKKKVDWAISARQFYEESGTDSPVYFFLIFLIFSSFIF